MVFFCMSLHFLFIFFVPEISSLLHFYVCERSNSYTVCCPPVRGDNPQALASGLSYVQVDNIMV